MAKNNNPLEKEVQLSIIKYLHKINIGTVIRNNTGAFKIGSRFIKCGIAGTSDLAVELHNSTQTLWIECKRIGGKPTEEQLEFLERQRARGNPAFIAHSVAEVEAELKKLGLVA